MKNLLTRNEEKKVEYLELIYDLIFVYVIGRNNSLLHQTTNGFVDGKVFLAYILCTFTIIQIWNFSIYYINMHGRNGLRDHICLFINMFLMYFIAEGIGSDWQDYYLQYHIAWALILLNIGIQYLIELRNHQNNKELRKQLKRMSIPLFVEAAAVIAVTVIYKLTGVELSWIAILIGVIVSFFINIK